MQFNLKIIPRTRYAASPGIQISNCSILKRAITLGHWRRAIQTRICSARSLKRHQWPGQTSGLASRANYPHLFPLVRRQGNVARTSSFDIDSRPLPTDLSRCSPFFCPHARSASRIIIRDDPIPCCTLLDPSGCPGGLLSVGTNAHLHVPFRSIAHFHRNSAM